MANRSRFFIAQGSIKDYFKKSTQKAFSSVDLQKVLDSNMAEWNLPVSMNLEKFLDKLVDANILKSMTIPFVGSTEQKIRFVHDDASPFQIAVSLVNKSHLSHYSAAFIHGLTTQVPKTIYLSFEQSMKASKGSLNQSSIDAAFARPQRRSTTEAILDGYNVLILNSANSNQTGIYVREGLPITTIERTLIDITVRPNYAGGVHSVLGMYEQALSVISVNKLIAILEKLNFVYPYQQSIGFYLEKAGYKGKWLDELQKRKTSFRFYLTYEMEEKDYSPDWSIYYPRGL